MKNKPLPAHIIISQCHASDPRWQGLMADLQTELKQLYPAMPDLAELPDAQLLLAHGEEGVPALGCVAMQVQVADDVMAARVVEIKRLFVHPAARGNGLAKRLLKALEALAWQQQASHIRLETGYLQHAAMALYQAMGYVPIPAYGPYIGQSFSRCFEKTLAQA